MIQGTVTTDGVPTVTIAVADKTWPAILDTGFNGDLELPEALRPFVTPRFLAPTEWLLAGGQRTVEDTYEVEFPFDGEVLAAEATFVPDDSILIGTGQRGREYLARQRRQHEAEHADQGGEAGHFGHESQDGGVGRGRALVDIGRVEVERHRRQPETESGHYHPGSGERLPFLFFLLTRKGAFVNRPGAIPVP